MLNFVPKGVLGGGHPAVTLQGPWSQLSASPQTLAKMHISPTTLSYRLERRALNEPVFFLN